MSGRNGGVVITSSGDMKPKGLIDAISEIEQFYTTEQSGSEIPERFFTTKNKIEFFEVGFKGAFISGLITALLLPWAIGVFEKKVPVFGVLGGSWFDQIFAMMLAFSFTIGYAVFIASIGRYYEGAFTKSMVRCLLSGVVIGAVFKMVIAFLFFHFLYFVILTEDRLSSALLHLQERVAFETLDGVYRWVLAFKPVFLTSAWLVVLTTLIFITIPMVTVIMKSLYNRNRGGF